MKPTILKRFLQFFKSSPGPRFVAQQLRKPSGEFAEKIGSKMDTANEPLYDLTLDAMEIKEDDRILEIGFGTGRFFSKLLSKANKLHLSGIDYSREMVEIAKENNKGFIEAGKLDVSKGSSIAIPFPDGSFDIVFCNMVIYFWDDPENHLREVHRVLKGGGRFYTGLRSRESMHLFPFVKHGFNLYEAGEWSRILCQNGFSLIDIHRRMDPEIEVEGNEVSLESYCIAATKDNVANWL